MRRADRLFLIIHALRGRRSALPARRLAEQLAVSLRTVYRDVADLQLSGVPIEGEAGVGYVLRKGADVPPLMFQRDEIEALALGLRLARAFGGARLAQAAWRAQAKVEAASPPELQARARNLRVFAPTRPGAAPRAPHVDALHAAIDGHRVLAIEYRDERDDASAREVEPLCLAFWGHGWTLGAWCRLRRDFRSFRLDRIQACAETGATFAETSERGLAGYLRSVGADALID